MTKIQMVRLPKDQQLAFAQFFALSNLCLLYLAKEHYKNSRGRASKDEKIPLQELVQIGDMLLQDAADSPSITAEVQDWLKVASKPMKETSYDFTTWMEVKSKYSW